MNKFKLRKLDALVVSEMSLARALLREVSTDDATRRAYAETYGEGAPMHLDASIKALDQLIPKIKERKRV